MERNNARYGWVRDLPDQRDHLYAAPPPPPEALPPKVDMRAQNPPVYDQQRIGSCTANAIAAAFEFDRMKQKLADFVPSRLFIYYNERAMEGSIGADSGAQIRDGIKSVAQLGVCTEKDWPYDGNPFPDEAGDAYPPNKKLTAKPSAACYKAALRYKALQYQRVPQMLSQMKGCLASGYPFVFGFTVYESFEGDDVARTGIMPMPHATEKVLGGHATLAVGYSDDDRWFTVRNSWGDTWGQQGYFVMPYAYLMDSNLSDDLWTIRSVT